MRIKYAIFAVLEALIVGFCIQRAAGSDGVLPILYYSAATINTGFCFWNINKFMETKEEE